MVEETQGPGGDETGLEQEAPRPARPRATQPAARRDGPPRAGGMPSFVGTALAAAVLMIAGGGVFAGGYFTNAAVDDDGGGSGPPATATAPSGAQTPVVQATPTPPVVVENVSVDDDPGWGPEDAPVTIIEFSDFQCPFCSRFFTQAYPQIKQAYEGKVRFVYRDFPLASIHENAQKAAEAGECADDQGKFWDYHDMMFSNPTALDVTSLKGYASQLGLDSGAFDQCLDSGKYTEEVQKDYQDGISYGVTGTPAFFVNGLLVVGAQPFANFKDAIDAALQEAGG